MLEIEKTNINTDDLISEKLSFSPMDDEEIFGFKNKYFQNIHLLHKLFEELHLLSENRTNLENKSILLKKELSKYEDLEFIKIYKNRKKNVFKPPKFSLDTISDLTPLAWFIGLFGLFAFLVIRDYSTNLSPLHDILLINFGMSLLLSIVTYIVPLIFLSIIYAILFNMKFYIKHLEKKFHAKQQKIDLSLELYHSEINKYDNLKMEYKNILIELNTALTKKIIPKDFYFMFHTYDNDFNIQIRDELNLRNDQAFNILDLKNNLEKIKSIKEKFPNLS